MAIFHFFLYSFSLLCLSSVSQRQFIFRQLSILINVSLGWKKGEQKLRMQNDGPKPLQKYFDQSAYVWKKF